ncbi:MAG: methyltransferase domain-containing protein [Methylococcales bacterium]|nr:methyltransferase domain-containing protein [Methylococcales bacterium]
MAGLDREQVKRRYNRIAPWFDTFEALLEGLSFRRWRQLLWRQVTGEHILEVGVGTGKNFPFYPARTQITALDFSPGMLAQAQRKLKRLNLSATLTLMDVERLQLGNDCFDSVVASFVFCSVPAPRRGLKEIHRVLKPGGQALLLEHVISNKPWLAWLMQRLDPVISGVFGAHINRDTVKQVKASGFQHVHVIHLNHWVKLIRATK